MPSNSYPLSPIAHLLYATTATSASTKKSDLPISNLPLSAHRSARLAATYLLLLLGNYLPAIAQSYGNEWIDYAQTYYKIKVGKDALYRIPYSTLQGAGLPNNATGYHLYRNGAEVPIYISDNEFDDNDYIEFYGKRNDGAFDTRLYAAPEQQPSPYKNLFSDTATYFLVWKPAPTDALFNNIANDISNAPLPMPYFMHRQLAVTANTYSGGRPVTIAGINYNSPLFDECEGWVSALIAAPNTQNYNVNTPAVYTATDAPLAQWTIKVAGRSNDPAVAIDHHLRLALNGATVADTTFVDYDCLQQSFAVAATDLTMPQTQLTITPVGDISASDALSVAYFQVTYPRHFDFGNQRLFEFNLPHNQNTYLEITNFNGETAPVLYDLTNLRRVIPVVEGGIYKIRLDAGSDMTAPRRLLLCNTTSPISVVTVGQLMPRTFTDYSQATNQGNYLIVSHPALMAGDTNFVAEYADYRRSIVGGNHIVSTANIDELYDQFAYGTAKNPLAIANFVHFAADIFDSIPSHLLLLGKATMLSESGLVSVYQQCLVPTYGIQPSDVLLTAYDRNAPLPTVAIGRVPAQNPAELRAYLRKVKDYESEFGGFVCADTTALWRRKVIGLATENDPVEYANAIARVRSYADSLSVGAFAADTLGIYGQIGDDPTPLPQFEQAINSGVGMVFFAGKQDNNYWRMDVQNPTAYNNPNRYPFVVSQSDFIGNIHAQQPTMASDFVLADQRGAIGFLDNTLRAIAPANHQYTTQMIARLRSSEYEQSIGTVVNHTIADLYGNGDSSADLIALTYTLAGDPALSIVPARKPELLVHQSELMFYTAAGVPVFSDPAHITANMSHFEARLQVWNVGKNSGDSCNVRVKRWLPTGDILDVLTQRMAVPRERDTISLLIPNNLPQTGINTFLFTVDYGNEVDEMCESNNTLSKAADIDLYNSIEPILSATQYRAYPIPTHDNLTIETQIPATLTLYDVQGKPVWQQWSSIGIQVCPTAQFAAGLYVLQIVATQGTATLRVVVW